MYLTTSYASQATFTVLVKLLMQSAFTLTHPWRSDWWGRTVRYPQCLPYEGMELQFQAFWILILTEASNHFHSVLLFIWKMGAACISECCTEVYSITFQKTVILIFSAVETSGLSSNIFSFSLSGYCVIWRWRLFKSFFFSLSLSLQFRLCGAGLGRCACWNL